MFCRKCHREKKGKHKWTWCVRLTLKIRCACVCVDLASVSKMLEETWKLLLFFPYTLHRNSTNDTTNVFGILFVVDLWTPYNYDGFYCQPFVRNCCYARIYFHHVHNDIRPLFFHSNSSVRSILNCCRYLAHSYVFFLRSLSNGWFSTERMFSVLGNWIGNSRSDLVLVTQ